MAPIEVKSGRDYATHSALSVFVKNEAYRVKHGYVLSNEREVLMKGKAVLFYSAGTYTQSCAGQRRVFSTEKRPGRAFCF